jgi:Tol biopolymer transport system component
VPNTRGGTWGPDDTILFAASAVGPLVRVPASGGEPVVVTRLEPGIPNHRFPQFLPGGWRFLFYVLGGPDVRGVYLGQLDDSGSRRLFDADSAARFVSGHLLFVRQGTLFAQRFDEQAGALKGAPVLLAEDVAIDQVSASHAAVSASDAGPIVYRSSSAAGSRQFVWFDRSGRETGRAGDPRDGVQASFLALDGRRVAVQRVVNANSDIWVLDLERGVFSRLTTDGSTDIHPVFAPDGRTIVFGSNRKGPFALYQKAATGTGEESLVLSSAGQNVTATDWSKDGRFLLYRTIDPKAGTDLWVLPMQGDRKPVPVAGTEFEEREGQFSPDGRWIAYQSNETGRFEIYVQPFPGPGGRVQVSSEGGAQVRWRPDGRELFYIALDGRLMAVPISFDRNSTEARAGTPVPLFATRVGGAVQSNMVIQYAVSPDGRRFLMNTVTDDATAPITMILNWRGAP